MLLVFSRRGEAPYGQSTVRGLLLPQPPTDRYAGMHATSNFCGQSKLRPLLTQIGGRGVRPVIGLISFQQLHWPFLSGCLSPLHRHSTPNIGRNKNRTSPCFSLLLSSTLCFYTCPHPSPPLSSYCLIDHLFETVTNGLSLPPSDEADRGRRDSS